MKILIQGATTDEIDVLLEHFNPKSRTEVAGYEFFVIETNGNTIIISLTQKGIINATISTTIALLSFKPDLVINQGCAGAQIDSLKIGDIIIGEESKYINDYKTPIKPKGAGSNSLEWTPHATRSYVTKSTPKFVEIAQQVKTDNLLIVGTLGSGDLFSREADRINYLHSHYNHLCEDMESAAVLKVCEQFDTARIAFRIISNNELTSSNFDASTRTVIQRFVIDFVSKITSLQ